ncbi:MAG TPA: dihydrofolate reductase family protein [Nitriliruptorales bacterium]|nr:dihydrofolate reductase family protein [Nitriliruptorales bacterium]
MVDGGERCRDHHGATVVRCREPPRTGGARTWVRRRPDGHAAFFVVTHSPPADVRLQRELGMRVTLVGDLAAAIDQARAAATHGSVVIMGGGDVVGQALVLGLVDELGLHLAPMILGGGTPLFKPGTRQRYRQRDVRTSRNAVHLTYERM